MLVVRDFEGRPAKEPTGVTGFVGTLISVSLVAAIYYGAGIFSNLLGQ